ncbi:MAG TPA: DNA repair photolyase [Rhodospirillaceae bacterium]|nr:DNA repair photolyase [Rhodospirillaceae bacterium]HAA92184.1 DNA repair photolyase [Rhodospirillaceae bacterium]HAT34983.1 DNA repair photolyase [Rhodospirillaceae bacterium]
MILSASYKTDIPAFYSEWFRSRLRMGLCESKNPFNGKISQISLDAEEIDAIVFWTRNIHPLLDYLDEIRAQAPFSVQFTITNYPRALETSTIACENAVSDLRKLANLYGPKAVVWRYDPILFSTLTPAEWHQKNFAKLARDMAGAVDEVVVSFAHIYRKTKRNLDQAAEFHEFHWIDPDGIEKEALLENLRDIADLNGIRLTICAQKEYLVPGVDLARCIDAERLSEIAGAPIVAPKQGNRPDCLCHKARDIGAYDSCPHGCRYCYAVNNHTAAKANYRDHQPEFAMLGKH